MELYSAKIVLGGSRDNEVRRSELTAAEVLILKQMHGQEYVTEVQLVGRIDRTQKAERVRLLGEGETPGLYSVENIRKVFPSDMTPLPEALPAEMISIEAMAADLKKAEGAKPVEEMSDEEIDKEMALLDTRRKNMAKARAAKTKKAEEAQVSALD